jgi:predicted transcriptional regulator
MTTVRLTTEKARVLHAALSLPTFTIEQLANISGVAEATVRSTIDRCSDLVERVSHVETGKAGGRRIVYRLRESERTKFAADVAKFAQQLRANIRDAEPREDPVRQAEVALDALESSIGFARDPGETGETVREWRERARRHEKTCSQLIELVPVGDKDITLAPAQEPGQLDGRPERGSDRLH